MNVDEARRALRQVSDLDPSEVRPILGGWAFWTFEVDGRWIFRFPRTDRVARALQAEGRLLPELAAAVSFEVPVPHWWGTWKGRPFFGYRKIEGQPLRAADVGVRSALLGELASMVSELHAFPADLARRLLGVEGSVEIWRARYDDLGALALERVAPLVSASTARRLGAALTSFLGGDFDFTPVLVHGDLGTEHVLVDQAGPRPVGMIDFESARVGDPAIDFVGLWITLGPDRTTTVLDAYEGPIDDGFAARLRAYWWFGSVHAVLYGLDEGRGDIVDDGLRELDRRLSPLG